MEGIQEKIPISSEIEAPSLGCSMLLYFITPILQISVGAVYLEECPIQENIPIFLITFGIIQLVLNFTTCLSCKDSKNDTLLKLRRGCTVLKSITNMFLFCNVWVYSIYQPSYSKNATDVSSYCNKTLYLVAFWTITAVYIILGLILLFLLMGCCILSCLLSCDWADSDNHNTSDNDDNTTRGDHP